MYYNINTKSIHIVNILSVSYFDKNVIAQRISRLFSDNIIVLSLSQKPFFVAWQLCGAQWAAGSTPGTSVRQRVLPKQSARASRRSIRSIRAAFRYHGERPQAERSCLAKRGHTGRVQNPGGSRPPTAPFGTRRPCVSTPANLTNSGKI